MAADTRIPFERSVFLNCPFDDDFSAILQAMAFCIIDLGFSPRLATENADNGASRLNRIRGLIESSQYGIHDLSRCRARTVGEYARFNMPFELGMDHASTVFGDGKLKKKTVLVLESKKYDYQKALSDISGWDIETHNNDVDTAVRIVRNWLVEHAHAAKTGAAKIMGDYTAFQEWYWDTETASGASPADITQYPTMSVVRRMGDWFSQRKPV